MNNVDRDTIEAARAAVQAKINWLKEERERLDHQINEQEKITNQRKREKQQIEDDLRKLEAFMHGMNETPRGCDTCKKRGYCPGPAIGRAPTGCSFWAEREEEQE